MRSHFARYGHVVEALVMLFPDGMGRNFGFVEFQDEEAALRALDVRQRDEHNAFFGRRVSILPRCSR
jgi:RNA-binding protein Musashi